MDPPESPSLANRDEAMRCLAIARRALAEGDKAKAGRFVEKAKRLYPCSAVDTVMAEVHGEAPTANGHHSSAQHKGHQSHSSNSQQHARANGTSDRGSSHQDASTSGGPRGMNGGGLRHRAGHGHETVEQEDKGTPEQKKMVADILKAKTFYEILEVPKDAGDDDIKKAYRKLALKLHPDKNKALRSDEAFKAVSKAFSCLSDPDKRAYYDRTGFEDSSAAAAAQQPQRRGGVHPMYQQNGYDDFDPEEIFRMFFGGAFHPGGRVFRTQFGGAPQRRAHAQRQHAPQNEGEANRNSLLGLLQLLPIVLLLAFTVFQGTTSPVWSLTKDPSRHPDRMVTERLEIPFFVKNRYEFERNYPRGGGQRFRVERQVESEFYDRLQNKCQQEKMQKHRLWTWGNREEAKNMKLPSCDEMEDLNRKLGAYSRGY